MTASIVSLVALILLSGFFSGTETAYTSLSLVQIEGMKRKYGKRAEIIENLTQRPDRLLTTILIGNNVVNIAASALASEIVIREFGSEYLGIMTGVLTLVLLIFGEVTPKQLAIQNNEFVTAHTVRIILALTYVFFPVTWVVGLASTVINSLSGRRKRQRITLETFLHLISHAENMGILENARTRILKNVFRFSNVVVQAIMTHRTHVFSLDKDSVIRDVLPDIISHGYSRVPVFDSDPEKIVGVVLVKDIMREISVGRMDQPLKKIMVSPIFVPENRKINRMLAQFKREKLNMAIVLDEYGGLAGIVTLEDVIEEIIGDLYDEHEIRDREKITKIDGNSFLIQGDTPIYVLNDVLGIELPHNRNIQTLGGYLSEVAGRIPAQFEVIETPAGRFIIESISRKQILSVRYVAADAEE